LDVVLARGGGTSLVEQLCGQLRHAMMTGRLAAGQQLPSSRELCGMLGVARNTVSAALDQLAREGFIDVRQGRRPVVALPASLQRRGEGGNSSRPAKLHVSQWARKIRASGWPFRSGVDQGPFAPGLADAREFPHDLWARCLRSGARWALLQGDGDVNYRRLRHALLMHLMRERGIRAQPSQIFFTPSAQAALELCARLVLDPGDLAWMESPGYPGARAALRNAGAIIAGVGVDTEGMAFEGRRDMPRAVFVTPSHQYPTGALMSISRRKGLLALAARAGAAIVEDDYDSEFHYEGKPVAALQGLDTAGHVFYAGTFSKALFSGIRVGYMIVPESFVDIFEQAQRHTGQIVASALQYGLAEFIEQGYFSAHIRRMNRIYRTRRDFLVEALEHRLAGRLRVQPPPGGMQLLAKLAPGIDDTAVVQSLADLGISARALSQHYIEPGGEAGLFLGFSASTNAEMLAAVALLEQCLSRRPFSEKEKGPQT